MLVLKYNKIDAAKFISHIDILRSFSRVLRRAGVTVNYSHGFNPHALLFFSPPMSLGVGSVCEYVAVDAVGMGAAEFLERYNRSASSGFSGIACYETEKNPNLAGVVTCAKYIFPCPSEGVVLGDTFEVTYLKKGESVTEDVRSKVFAVGSENGLLTATLALGNTTLRADRFALGVQQHFGYSVDVTKILKVEQYATIGDKVVNVDTLLGSKAE